MSDTPKVEAYRAQAHRRGRTFANAIEFAIGLERDLRSTEAKLQEAYAAINDLNKAVGGGMRDEFRRKHAPIIRAAREAK